MKWVSARSSASVGGKTPLFGKSFGAVPVKVLKRALFLPKNHDLPENKASSVRFDVVIVLFDPDLGSGTEVSGLLEASLGSC